MNSRVGNYVFKDPRLLSHALRHPSVDADPEFIKSRHPPNNDALKSMGFQRLEFMGDSVLNIVITDVLMDMFPNEQEGDLSKRRAYLVSREACYMVCCHLNLAQNIQVGINTKVQNTSILTDALEAVIGAIYYDSNKDMSICKSWILHQWDALINTGAEFTPNVDPKTRLQEWTQAHRMHRPEYHEVGRIGPDHDLTLQVEVNVKGVGVQPMVGEGRTKKSAEKEAAIKLLQELMRIFGKEEAMRKKIECRGL